ncbi:hypothetical protein CVT24_005439 [Panaeolus cyanescens]|uniref:Uncharacterized protein n=1 Tax=Panaeolus cyanescens TaxID=181874 RepID=A0A409X4X9_9AGAR|nr:hypothetical protein CVT24_005439 [Panaeolus cyanescens]
MIGSQIPNYHLFTAIEQCKSRTLAPEEGFQGVSSILEDENLRGHSVHDIPSSVPLDHLAPVHGISSSLSVLNQNSALNPNPSTHAPAGVAPQQTSSNSMTSDLIAIPPTPFLAPSTPVPASPNPFIVTPQPRSPILVTPPPRSPILVTPPPKSPIPDMEMDVDELPSAFIHSPVSNITDPNVGATVDDTGLGLLPSASITPAITLSTSLRLAAIVSRNPPIPSPSLSAFRVNHEPSPPPLPTKSSNPTVTPVDIISGITSTPPNSSSTVSANDEEPLTSGKRPQDNPATPEDRSADEPSSKRLRPNDTGTSSVESPLMRGKRSAHLAGLRATAKANRGRGRGRGRVARGEDRGGSSKMVVEVSIPLRSKVGNKGPSSSIQPTSSASSDKSTPSNPSSSSEFTTAPTPSNMPPVPEVAVTLAADNTAYPDWFKKTVDMFRTKSLHLGKTGHLRLGDEWIELVDAYVDFEVSHAFSPIRKLTSKLRPAVVGMWIGRGRSVTWRPDIPDVKAFGKEFNEWWLDLQPAWRVVNGKLNWKEVDGNWECLRCPGVNGLLSIVAVLFYWGLVAYPKGGTRLPWLLAMEDVTIALKKLKKV